MKIHTLSITSFGKFKNKTLSFEEGINYIYGENEAGKTTVMAFIKAMLYGFSGRGADGDRKKYMPWEGGSLSGEMEVTLKDGRRIVISRAAGKTPAQDVCNILDAVTGEKCDVDLIGEIGFGENAFLKTVFLRQNNVGIDGGDEELTDKLLNLAGSGNADTGFDEAMTRLADEMRIYRHLRGDGGKINALRREVDALSDELAKAQAENQNFFRYRSEEKALREEILKIEARREALEAAILAAKADATQKQAEEAGKKRSAIEEARKEALETIQALEEKQTEYAAFEEKLADFYFAPAENPKPHIEMEGKAKKARLWLCLAAGCALFGGIGCLLIRQLLFGGAAVMLALLMGIMTIGWHKRIGQARKEILRIEKENAARDAALSAFGCTSVQDYMDKRAQKLALDEKLEAAKEKKTLLEKTLQEASSREGVVVLSGEAQKLEREKAEADELYAGKIRKLAEIEGFLKGSLDGRKTPDMILSARAAKMEELEEAEKEFAALSLAAKTLEEVRNELSRDFTPRINEKASAYLSEITGKEEKLLLDKKYAVTMGRETHRPLKAFSGGTMDQAFLAVRLAVSALVLADPEMPIFLDDSFMQYDDAREGNTLRLLEKLSKERQIFWFSCKKREDGNINRITL